MTLPKEAKLERILPGKIAIYDISHILSFPSKPSNHLRPVGTKIVRVFFHHSGAYGKDGFAGAKNSVNYVIEQRNFGARPYHFWISYKPDYDADGNMVIYRLAPDSERAWHTGALANDNGIGVVWQGNLSDKGNGKPTDAQYKMAEALTNWLIGHHDLSLPDGLSFHAEAKKWGADKNKSSCPGPYVQKWVTDRREKVESEPEPEVVEPEKDESIKIIVPAIKSKKNLINFGWIKNLFGKGK